jgi:hypothetical protein
VVDAGWKEWVSRFGQMLAGRRCGNEKNPLLCNPGCNLGIDVLATLTHGCKAERHRDLPLFSFLYCHANNI